MSAAVRMPRLSPRSAGVIGLVAVALGALVVPSATAAVKAPATDAALIQIAQEGEQLRLGAVDRDGTRLGQGDVIAVSGVEPFTASLDATTIPADSGPVTITVSEPALPGVEVPGPSVSTVPELRVSSPDGGQLLLGTATDAPDETSVDAGALLPAQWWFSAPGEYRVTLTASVTAADGALRRSEPSTLTFHVAGEPAPAPDAEPSPEPVQESAPAPQPVPESVSELDSAAGQAASTPPGQSDQPAPASREKRVIENVHTDTVSAYLDEGALVLESKADIDVDGNGTIDLGTRLKTSETLFHLSDKGRTHIPDLPAFGFLGTAGTTIWMAPQTQNHDIIWTGFSTEDPNLRGNVGGDALKVRLLSTEGPGDAEVFMQSGTVQRIFSSVDDLPDWAIGVPQHTHMNWAFTKPGTYTFTFEMEGTVAGRSQKAQNRYTFVVGDLDHHTQTTTTTLESSTGQAEQGELVLLAAEVAPAGVEGAVQFRDVGTNVVLGHTPVADGRAAFAVDALTPGRHRIVAEFVPTWSDDATTSVSRPVTLTIGGEVQPKPDFDDDKPVPPGEITARTPGTTVTVTSPGKKIGPGETLTARVTEPDAAGRWLSIWLPGQSPAWRGWVQADLNGSFSIDSPEGIGAGAHQLVVKREDGSFTGWDSYVVETRSGGGGVTPPPPVAPPVVPPQPQAPGQQCVPGVTLEHGHIDAFYVSAANGTAVLQLMEDVTGYHVIREAESVLLRVKESAYRTSIPAPGGPRGYVLPLTQDAGLIWPGWDTNRTSASGFTDVSISVTGVDGPGQVYLYTQGSFGDWKPILTHGGYAFPGTIREKTPAHTHAQWVFPEKGIYKLTAHAVATNPSTGASIRTAAHTYVFQVGDVPLGDAFCGLSSADVTAAAAVNLAVNQAASEAVAAAQADAAAKADEHEAEDERKPRREDASQADDEGLLASIFGEDVSPVAVAGIIGGGVLILGGIVGGTVWYVRRLQQPAVTADPASTDT